MQRIVLSPVFAPPCLTLAERLDEHEIVGGEAFLELFDPFQPSEGLVLAADQKEDA